jgi:hypothetical protein
MRWKGGRRSTNVQDRRGAPVGRGMKLGGGTILIALVAMLLLGQNPLSLLEQLMGGAVQQPASQAPRAAGEDEAADFVSVILASTEDVWGEIFAQSGQQYPAPQLVLFSDAAQSACGFNTSATGPFYCPGDQQVYLDLGFLNELQRLGAPGDFAFAYVIAHEIGHHIQTITGLSDEVRRLQARSSQTQANQLSVLQELQADCFAGMWAKRANERSRILESGDVEEGLRAAASIGDDRLQRMSGRSVQPEAFTHGSSEQRVQWFRTGLEQGSIEACDTFATAGLR